MFGLHFEPMCHEPHTFEIHLSQENAPHIHAHKSRHTHVSHVHTHDTRYAHVYTCTHCGRKGHIVKFTLIELMIQILQIDLFGLGKVLTPMDLIEYGYQNLPLLYLM